MHKKKVLLADDHAVIRNGLKQILADSDEFLVAGEASNAVEVMQQVRQDDWGLVILDLSMPGRSGVDLIRAIKGEKPALPVLVFSMHQEDQYAVRALKAGAAGYVTKESDVELVLDAAQRVASGGVYLTPKVAELMVRGTQASDPRQPHETLSDREYQVFNYVVAGLGLSEIARELSLSVKTISTHKTHIFEKLGVSNTTDLVRYALARGLACTGDV